jgi:hypothetical protein
MLTPSSVQQNSKSPLLQLPAEIRNQIFEKALSNLVISPGDEDGTFCYVKDFDDEGARYQSGVAFVLLRVCRQIYAETSLMPCARNTLVLSYTNLLNLRQRSNFRSGAPALLLGQRDAIRSVGICSLDADLFYNPKGVGELSALPPRGRGHVRLTDFFPNLERVVFEEEITFAVWDSWVRDSGFTSVVEMVRTKEGRDDLEVVEGLTRHEFRR